MTRRFRSLLAAGVASVFCCTAGALADTGNPFLNTVQSFETGNQSNPYGTNTGNGAYGAFQQRATALTDIGYMNRDGSWNAQASGASSLQAYLQCDSCQVQGETSFLQKQWSYANSNGLVSNYLGKTVDGVTYNQSAILECSQQLGAGGCLNYLNGGGGASAGGNPHFEADVAKASMVDSSAITGGFDKVDNSAAAAGGSLSSAAALAQMETYCAAEVNALMNQVGQQAINNAAALAGSGVTGYTLLNGQGVMDAVNTPNSQAFFIDPSSSSGFQQLSCVDNLMNGLGVNGIFNPPSLSSIISQLKGAVCQAAAQGMSQLTQPVSQALGQATSSLQPSLSTGGFFPGLSLSSLVGNYSIGQGGSGGLSVNGTGVMSVLNNANNWYSAPSAQASSGPTFEGLFQ